MTKHRTPDTDMPETPSHPIVEPDTGTPRPEHPDRPGRPDGDRDKPTHPIVEPDDPEGHPSPKD